MARSTRLSEVSRRVAKFRKQTSRRLKRAEKTTGRHVSRFLLLRWEHLRSSRKWIAGWLLLVAALIGATAAQFVWFQRDYQITAAADGGTYVEGTYGSIDTLNPLYAATRSEKAVQKLVFSSLYQYDDSGALRPDIATAIKPSKDAKTFTVSLRPGITWHDGEDLTAQDVAFTVDLMKDEATGSSLASTFQAVSAQAIDDRTVKFTLDTPYSMFQHALTFAILPRHILKDVDPLLIREHEFSYQPVGSGPFEMKLLQTISVENGEKIAHLVANDSYYGGAPYLNRYEVHSYTSHQAIAEALQDAEINASTDILDTSGIDGGKYTIDDVPVGSGVFAIFNTSKGALESKAVRQALQLGTDTNAVRHEVGHAVRPMPLPFVTDKLHGGPVVKLPANDIKKANSLLQKAGWKFAKNQTTRSKKGKMLTLKLVIQKGDQHGTAARQLAKQWANLGIDTEIIAVDSASPGVSFSQDYLRPRQYDVLLYDLLIGADLDSYPYWHSSQATEEGLNFADYDSVVADEAIISARLTVNPALRRAKARAFAKQWVKDVPALGLYQKTISYVHSQAIHSYGASSELVSANDQYGSVTSWYMKERPVYKTP